MTGAADKVEPLRVLIIGSGLMGSQIGCEYALAGHEVTFIARRPDEATRRVRRALALAVDARIADSAAADSVEGAIVFRESLGAAGGEPDLVVESIVEDADAKAQVLGEAASRFPEAIIASNTSSIPLSQLGMRLGAPERTIGTHYWNPPLLMPLVEITPGDRTASEVVQRMQCIVSGLGKQPILVARDVPGFIWNRLQLALLREALWLVKHQVASPQAVDQVVRSGLARRWRYTGPFESIALGGVDSWSRVAHNLFPVLAVDTDAPPLDMWPEHDEPELETIRARRDRGLIDELSRERLSST